MPDVEDGDGCVCGGKIAPTRRDGFCSSWCRSRDEQGLPPQSPPPLVPPAQRPTVLVPVASSGAGEASGEGPRDASRSAEPAAEPSSPPADDEHKRPSYRARRRLIADEVEDRLRKANLLDSWQASGVLDLADALDWQGGSLSARATAHRELWRQMDELLRGQDEPGSGVGGMRDELAERKAQRAQRAAGGAG